MTTTNRKARQPQRTCAKKKVYDSYWQAIKKAFVYFQNYKVWQSPYECDVCGRVHLTSHPGLRNKS